MGTGRGDPWEGGGDGKDFCFARRRRQESIGLLTSNYDLGAEFDERGRALARLCIVKVRYGRLSRNERRDDPDAMEEREQQRTDKKRTKKIR